MSNPTNGAVKQLLVWLHTRSGLDRLPAHLETRYQIRVRSLAKLDAGVFRVERDDGPPWVARVFPAVRPVAAAEGDAAVLRYLEAKGIPAERCAHPEPVSVLDGQGVLVTGYVDGHAAESGERTIRALAEMTGRLQTLPPDPAIAAREAGALHYASPQGGGPGADIAAVNAWLAEAADRVLAEHRAMYAAICERVARADDLHDLPRAMIHPDPVPRNVIATADGQLVPIDWTGAGGGARIAPLGFLLWQAGPQQVDVVVAAYRPYVRLDDDELARLTSAVARPALVLTCFQFACGRTTVPELAQELAAILARAKKIAAMARAAFAQGSNTD